MEPIGWTAQIELIRHGAPYSGLRPDARICRMADVGLAHTYALACISHLPRRPPVQPLVPKEDIRLGCRGFRPWKAESQDVRVTP